MLNDSHKKELYIMNLVTKNGSFDHFLLYQVVAKKSLAFSFNIIANG